MDSIRQREMLMWHFGDNRLGTFLNEFLDNERPGVIFFSEINNWKFSSDTQYKFQVKLRRREDCPLHR